MHGTQSSLLIGVVVLIVVVLVVLRRLRPQPVNPRRVAITGAIFVLVLLLSLGSGSSELLADIPALIAAPFVLVLGGVLGFVIVRSIRFWADQQTGMLWMRGGFVFAGIYVVTLALRLVASYAANATTGPTAHLGWVHGVSLDLVCLSIGMWIVRAVLIIRRYQQHVAQGGAPAPVAGPRNFS